MILAITNESLVIAALGYSIVFLVLLLLYLVFDRLPVVLGIATKARKQARDMRESLMNGKRKAAQQEVITGEVCAAIALAIHLHLADQHDEENRNLTIQKISRAYSPWSSKIYGVSNPFNQRIR